MNKEAMYKVADAIEKHNEVEFNMHVIAGVTVRDDNHEVCGTVGCVAGFTLLALAPNQWKKAIVRHTHAQVINPAAELLGLDYDEAYDLFIRTGTSYDDITKNRDKVPTILRWMADNDCPDWPTAIRALGLQGIIHINRFGA